MSEVERFWSTLRPEVGWLHVQLRRLGVPTVDVEDVTQEVLVQVFQRWMEFDGRRALRPWLMAFAHRVAANHRRHRKRHPEHRNDGSGSDEWPDPADGAEDVLAARQARAMVLEALDDLDLDRRSVFVMIELEEMTASEIASAFDLPLNTVYSRLRLARQDFASAVQRVKLRRGLR